MLSVLSIPIFGQEALNPSKVQARRTRKHPALVFPQRLDDRTDNAIWYEKGMWRVADSLKAQAFWTMTEVTDANDNGNSVAVFAFRESWASEKPKSAEVVG